VTEIGLVLGGGGVVGQAYHSGVLAALEHDLGWDPRRASVIVGTSAGSVTGVALRHGVAASDLAAWCVDAPLWGLAAEMAARISVRPEFTPLHPWSVLRPGRLPGRRLVARAVRAPWRIRPTTWALTMLRDGELDIDQTLDLLDELPAEWPERDLWICAVRRDDGRRVTFGRPGTPATRPRAAVAASCAVPGYFKPVLIGGRAYIDGGVHSPTNADVLHRRRLDLVIVVAPLAGSPTGWSLEAELRRLARRRLRHELAVLERLGQRVVVLEPGAPVIEAMGRDVMDRAVVAAVVRESFLDAGEQIRALDHRDRALLGGSQDRGVRAAAAGGTLSGRAAP
jgi:NTE family protein